MIDTRTAPYAGLAAGRAKESRNTAVIFCGVIFDSNDAVWCFIYVHFRGGYYDSHSLCGGHEAGSMRAFSGDEALTHSGSLLSWDGRIVAPYDLEQQPSIPHLYGTLEDSRVLNASKRAFSLDYSGLSEVHIINGMGVALGDSVIGLTAVAWLRKINPALHCVIYRPARAPAHTNGLYQLAAGIVAEMRWLPRDLSQLPETATIIDLGNQLFWPQFESMPMIDFFFWALGVDSAEVPSTEKRNSWLSRLCLPDIPTALADRGYVLFCPAASTPIRSIPVELHHSFVEQLWQEFRLPVVGFEEIAHPRYTNIKPLSPDTGSFLAWVRGARYLLSTDTAAIHIAAGFHIPTTALFTTIPPDLRVRDYPLCRNLMLEVPLLNGMHASSREKDLVLLREAYRQLARVPLFAK